MGGSIIDALSEPMVSSMAVVVVRAKSLLRLTVSILFSDAGTPACLTEPCDRSVNLSSPVVVVSAPIPVDQ